MKVLFRLSLIAMIAVFAAIWFWSAPLILAGSGVDRVPEAMLLGYSADEARVFFAGITDAGRAQYLGPQAMLDWAFPALIALTLTLAVFRWGRRVPLPRRMLAILLAAAAVAVDYWENAQIAAALVVPADTLTDAALNQMSLATQGKTYLFVAASMVTGAVMLGGFIRKRRARRS